MYGSWVVYCRTPSRRDLRRFDGRAQKSWDRFDEYDSQEPRCVMLTSEKQRSVARKKSLPHQRSPYAMKFEDTSQEETERQERCARGDAWRLAKNIYKLKEKEKTTLISPTNEWSSPAPSTIKSEERDFVVDSSASMHVVSRKDLNSAELETVKVVAANGEVLTVYVRELFFRDSNVSRRYTCSSLTWKTLRKSRV